MFRRHYRRVKLLFGTSDVLLTALAFEAAYQTRLHLPGLFHFEHQFYLDRPVKALLLGAAVLIWLAIGYWFDIYEKLDSAHPMVVLRGTLRQCLVGAISLVLVQYMLRLDISRPFLLIFALYSWGLLCLFRLNAGYLLGAIRREFGAPHYVMVVGVGGRARRMAESLERSEGYGIRLTGFLHDGSEAAPETIQLGRSYPVYGLDRLPELLQGRVIDEVIFAVESSHLAGLEEAFLLCDEEGVRTRLVVDFFPHVNSDLYLDRLGNLPLLTFAAAPHDELRLVVKRATDMALAAAGLIVLMPVMGVIALLIRLTSPGPAIFRQVRCGLNGRRFVFYKFRSMCANAEDLKSSLQHLNQKTTAFKIPNDPRLTGIGRILRKFSIDEWPQLWNVLRGDMSLVGPRPAVPEEVDMYERWQRRRLRMRPGLTCLWALAGRDTLDFETWMKMDMTYIDNWSLALDWKIILRTIPKVILGKGAH
ncbi:MAG TPA: sugar transferase [Bryobacteraceae bacterium]|nr:sugar transferase [Bryobacteraceae bacterium]